MCNTTTDSWVTFVHRSPPLQPFNTVCLCHEARSEDLRSMPATVQCESREVLAEVAYCLSGVVRRHIEGSIVHQLRWCSPARIRIYSTIRLKTPSFTEASPPFRSGQVDAALPRNKGSMYTYFRPFAVRCCPSAEV